MAEGTKDASVDVQMVATVKATHKILAVDPDTGMFVGMTPEQLHASEGGLGSSDPETDDDFFDI
jgi:hypothetical protein